MVEVMVIRLVVFDADKTLWSHRNVSSLVLPLKPINQNVISDAEGETFHLFNGIRKLLIELKKKKVIITLASWNKPEPVKEALRLFEIDKFFKYVKAEFHPKKYLLIRDILSELSKEDIKVNLDEILYIDDRTLHLEQITRRIGRPHFLQMWVDVKTPNDILKYVGKV